MGEICNIQNQGCEASVVDLVSHLVRLRTHALQLSWRSLGQSYSQRHLSFRVSLAHENGCERLYLESAIPASFQPLL